MKTSLPLRTTRRGVALVLVLAVLVLMTALVVAFMTTATNELNSSKTYASGANLQQLAEATVNIVQSQIRDATAGFQNPAAPTVAGQLAWISQPGLLRTFDTAGAPVKAFKLYSSDQLQVAGAFDPQASLGTEVPADWNARPNEFTDLNSPVMASGTNQFPILDPPAGAINDPVGFRNNASDPTHNVVKTSNPAPMPVRWLYQLKDGKLVSHSDLSSVASAANPPVGRIAFWADDESAKVNINTAAGDEWNADSTNPAEVPVAGSFWGTPRYSTPFSRERLSRNQPVNKEFQRYPGHPATTYLGAVFPDATRDGRNGTMNLFSLVPRVNGGGSLGGTFKTTPNAGTGVSPDGDRLYASVDELMFSGTARQINNPNLTKDRLEKARFFLTANSRAPEVNLFNRPRITIWPVPYASNPGDETSKRTLFDRVFAFGSTVGGKAYYFQRHNWDASYTPTEPGGYLSDTDDYANIPRNPELYAYLQRLTGSDIPGFGGNFLAKYPGDAVASDRDHILTAIFDYIRSTNLQEQSEPNKTFTGRMPDRSSLVPGAGFVVPIKIGNTRGFGRFPTISEAAVLFYSRNVIPTSNVTVGSGPTAQTFRPGDYYTWPNIKMGAVLMFEMFNPSKGYMTYWPRFQIRVSNVGGGLMVNGSPVQIADGSVVRVDYPPGYRNAQGDSLGGHEGTNYLFQNSIPSERAKTPPVWKSTAAGSYAFSTDATGGEILMNSPTFTFNGGSIKVTIEPLGAPSDSTAYQTLYFHFPSATVPTPQMLPIGNPGPAATPATGYTMAFGVGGQPAFQRNLPLDLGFGNLIPRTGPTSWAKTPSGAVNLPPRMCDTVRSVEAAEGDPRIYFGLPTVGTSTSNPYFARYGLDGNGQSISGFGYDDSSVNGAHSLLNSEWYRHPRVVDRIINNQNYGRLVANANYDFGADPGWQDLYSQYPDVPLKFKTTGVNGDWDMGVTNASDGAFINKPDDGTDKYQTNVNPPRPPYFTEQFELGSQLFFSPNRNISSPVMFGSLPTGVRSRTAWQTLLFCAHPSRGYASHFGSQSPPDHALLDLFAMPVVEPYAISEPFSCAGRINLNTQIAPFTYIQRDTGIRALLRSTRVSSTTPTNARTYRGGSSGDAIMPEEAYHSINADETLKGWTTRFANNMPFKSASEICTMSLVPEGSTLDDIGTFWNTNTLTSDNEREKPYSDLYPRLTTKSNTYTVHLRVQTLQAQTNKAGFNPQTDFVQTGEYRGSYILERYIDPNDARLTDSTVNPKAPIDFAALPLDDPDGVLDKYYRFRVVSTKKFAP
jgi:uncharacterized protein (TIGR02600 family)